MTSDVPSACARPALGTFLREHRKQLAPEDVGIKRVKGRSRVGLSRAEVAALAHIPSPTTASSSGVARCARARRSWTACPGAAARRPTSVPAARR